MEVPVFLPHVFTTYFKLVLKYWVYTTELLERNEQFRHHKKATKVTVFLLLINRTTELESNAETETCFWVFAQENSDTVILLRVYGIKIMIKRNIYRSTICWDAAVVRGVTRERVRVAHA
jgi:hypothetical protein